MTTMGGRGFAEDALGRWNCIQWPPQFQFQFQVPGLQACCTSKQCNATGAVTAIKPRVAAKVRTVWVRLGVSSLGEWQRLQTLTKKKKFHTRYIQLNYRYYFIRFCSSLCFFCFSTSHVHLNSSASFPCHITSHPPPCCNFESRPPSSASKLQLLTCPRCSMHIVAPTISNRLAPFGIPRPLVPRHNTTEVTAKMKTERLFPGTGDGSPALLRAVGTESKCEWPCVFAPTGYLFTVANCAGFRLRVGVLARGVWNGSTRSDQSA